MMYKGTIVHCNAVITLFCNIYIYYYCFLSKIKVSGMNGTDTIF